MSQLIAKPDLSSRLSWSCALEDYMAWKLTSGIQTGYDCGILLLKGPNKLTSPRWLDLCQTLAGSAPLLRMLLFRVLRQFRSPPGVSHRSQQPDLASAF